MKGGIVFYPELASFLILVKNPTIILKPLAGAATEYTVGDGLTEVTAPTGTRDSDIGFDLYIGNESSDSRTFDGFIFGQHLFNYIPVSGDQTFYSNILNHLKYQDIVSSVADLVTNGGFDADTDWTKETGWTIAGGVAVTTGVTSSNGIYQSMLPVDRVGKIFRVTFTVLNYSAGNVKANVGAYNGGTSRSANGTYTEDIVCAHALSTQDVFILAASTFTGEINNVIVEQVGCVLSLDPAGMEYETDYWHDPYNNIFVVMTNVIFTRNNNSFPKAMYFDDSSYITIPSITYDLSQKWTFAFRVRLNTLTGHKIIFGNQGNSAYQFIMLKSNGVIMIESDTNEDQAYANLDTYDMEWHTYMVVVNNYVVTMYQDGVAQTMQVSSLSDDITIDCISHDTAEPMRGIIDWLGIWEEAKDSDFAELLAES